MLSAPPLTFQGNKKQWRNEIVDVINKINDDSVVYVDMFGGSGIISHWIKYLKPDATVIYNDHDFYINRLEKINQTNEILRRIRELVKDVSYYSKISAELKREIIKVIEEYDDPDLPTINQYLLFSQGRCALGDFETLCKSTFYNRINKSDLKVVNVAQYLKGLIIEHKDWKELYKDVKEKYKDKKILFILDPPYIYTDKSGYDQSNHYWKLKDSIQIIKILSENDYWLFFNSDKSGFDEVIEALNEALNLDLKIKFTKISKRMSSQTRNKFEYCLISHSISDLYTSS